MRYRYIHILAALFLIIGMAIQFVVSYRQSRHHIQERIDLKMQIAQEKLLFELYDAYEATDQLQNAIAENLSDPDNLFKETRSQLKYYTNFFSCYATFPAYYYPEKGKWFGPCSYRLKDSIYTVNFGDEQHDYFTREWYKGALKSGKKGYWSQPYVDEDFDETIFTHSNDMRDEQDNLVCIIAIDFSLSWMQQLLEQFKPFDEAVCVLYSSNGTLLTASDNLKGGDPSRLTKDKWILTRQTLNPVDIDMVIAVPKLHIWKNIGLSILLPFVVFMLGILVVGILIRRMWRDYQENIRLETEKKVIESELHIAHGIQMGILRHDFPQGSDMELHADLLPMHEVGGDLYDFNRKGDILWFIVGDVSGKGVPATMFMSATINLFRSALGHQNSPKAIMEEINAVLSDNNPSLTFVTAFIGQLHIPSGRLVFCNAGHVPPLVKSLAGNAKYIEMEPNIPLGYIGDYQFLEESFLLGEDEELMLYTDGVTEARNAARKMMGEQLWKDIAAHSEDLLGAVKLYIGEAEPTDDITIMTIRRNTHS